MVHLTITNLESAVKNVALIHENGQSPQQMKILRDAYFNDVFNGLLGLYVGLNLPIIKRAVYEGVSRNMHDEDHTLFSAMLAYIPNIADPRYVEEGIFSDAPSVVPLSEVNIEQRIKEMTSHTHDGAIIWGSTYADTTYMAIGDIWKRAIVTANALTGNNEYALDKAIAPLVPWPIKHETTQQRLVGLKTINGICLPLAIPGAVSFVLRSTVYSCGVGKVLMFDEKGLSLEGYVSQIVQPDVSEDLFIIPESRIAIVKNKYYFDEEARRLVAANNTEIGACKLGLREFKP